MTIGDDAYFCHTSVVLPGITAAQIPAHANFSWLSAPRSLDAVTTLNSLSGTGTSFDPLDLNVAGSSFPIITIAKGGTGATTADYCSHEPGAWYSGGARPWRLRCTTSQCWNPMDSFSAVDTWHRAAQPGRYSREPQPARRGKTLGQATSDLSRTGDVPAAKRQYRCRAG